MEVVLLEHLDSHVHRLHSLVQKELLLLRRTQIVLLKSAIEQTLLQQLLRVVNRHEVTHLVVQMQVVLTHLVVEIQVVQTKVVEIQVVEIQVLEVLEVVMTLPLLPRAITWPKKIHVPTSTEVVRT